MSCPIQASIREFALKSELIVYSWNKESNPRALIDSGLERRVAEERKIRLILTSTRIFQPSPR